MKKNFFVNVTAQQVYRRKLLSKISKIVFLLLLVIITVIYFFLYIIYNEGHFTISLDQNKSNSKNVYLSEDGTFEKKTLELDAKSLDYMDNISIHWIDDDIDQQGTGSHNGTNYIAYTFYVVNAGEEVVHYWYQMDIDDSIKEVDKALRIMIYHNGVRTVYAKENSSTGEAEDGTKKFVSDEIAVLEQKQNFAPGEKDRFTVVVWIEGDDPDCTNDLIGGEVKLHMDVNEEHIKDKE